MDDPRNILKGRKLLCVRLGHCHFTQEVKLFHKFDKRVQELQEFAGYLKCACWFLDMNSILTYGLWGEGS